MNTHVHPHPRHSATVSTPFIAPFATPHHGHNSVNQHHLHQYQQHHQRHQYQEHPQQWQQHQFQYLPQSEVLSLNSRRIGRLQSPVHHKEEPDRRDLSPTRSSSLTLNNSRQRRSLHTTLGSATLKRCSQAINPNRSFVQTIVYDSLGQDEILSQRLSGPGNAFIKEFLETDQKVAEATQMIKTFEQRCFEVSTLAGLTKAFENMMNAHHQTRLKAVRALIVAIARMTTQLPPLYHASRKHRLQFSSEVQEALASCEHDNVLVLWFASECASAGIPVLFEDISFTSLLRGHGQAFLVAVDCLRKEVANAILLEPSAPVEHHSGLCQALFAFESTWTEMESVVQMELGALVSAISTGPSCEAFYSKTRSALLTNIQANVQLEKTVDPTKEHDPGFEQEQKKIRPLSGHQRKRPPSLRSPGMTNSFSDESGQRTPGLVLFSLNNVAYRWARRPFAINFQFPCKEARESVMVLDSCRANETTASFYTTIIDMFRTTPQAFWPIINPSLTKKQRKSCNDLASCMLVAIRYGVHKGFFTVDSFVKPGPEIMGAVSRLALFIMIAPFVKVNFVRKRLSSASKTRVGMVNMWRHFKRRLIPQPYFDELLAVASSDQNICDLCTSAFGWKKEGEPLRLVGIRRKLVECRALELSWLEHFLVYGKDKANREHMGMVRRLSTMGNYYLDPEGSTVQDFCRPIDSFAKEIADDISALVDEIVKGRGSPDFEKMVRLSMSAYYQRQQG